MKTASANSISDAHPSGLAGSVSGADGFAMGWAAGQARALGDGASVLLLLRDPDGVLRPQGRAPDGLLPSDAMRAAAAAVAAHQGRPSVRRSDNGAVALAIAVRRDGVAAVAAAELPPGTAADPGALLADLTWGAQGIEAYLDRHALQDRPDPGGAAARQALDLLLGALETTGYRAASRAAATEIALAVGAERVSILRAGRQTARIAALSHAADFRKRSAVSDLLEAAALEALDQGEPLIWPAADADPALSRQALDALARQSGAGSVAALVMGDPGDPWGALVAEFAAAEAARAAAPALDLTADALAPLLEVKRRDDRWWITRAWEGLVGAAARVLGPSALGWKAATLVAAALIVAALTVTAPARVTADAEITAEGRVLISAPFDGFLSERLVRAGQRVRAGQVLVTLDERELTLEKLRHEATRSQKRIELDTAAATRDRARMSVLAAEIAETEAQLALTEAQLEAGRMRAPFDGIVASDATEGRIGAPLGRGEELLSVAPLDDRTVTLHVPDAQVDRVAAGQTGILRLAAMPEVPLPIEVVRVTPMTEARDGANTFRAEARLTGGVPPDLVHGMEGVAKVTTGRALWIMTWAEPLLEDIRLRLWSLWP